MKNFKFLSFFLGLVLSIGTAQAANNYNILDQGPQASSIANGTNLSNGAVTATGGSTAISPADRAAFVFNIADGYGGIPGAKCDGITNDNAAINATFAAAFASSAYTNNDAVLIIGPAGNTTTACIINSLNLTIFNKGTGANLRPRVTVRDMTLLCTGTGNICIDGAGADLLRFQNVSVRGDTTPNTPEICIQVGTLDGSTSSAWHGFENVHCNNEFALTDYYNMGSEDNLIHKSMFANAHISSGTINVLGAITAGSSYTNGTYTGVALTGGSGTGALATIVVSGNAVTAVTPTYTGRDYSAGDTLSASTASIGGTGSGFSIPVSSTRVYTFIADGQNYWRMQSAFQPVTATPNTWVSMTLVDVEDSSFRMLGNAGTPIWLGWSEGIHFNASYAVQQTADACINLFDNGVTKAGIVAPNWGAVLDLNCETSAATGYVRLSGANATPTLSGFTLKGYHQAANAIINDSNITAVTMNDANITLQGTTSTSPLFSNPGIWTISGSKVALPNSSNWSNSATFNGTLCIAGKCTFVYPALAFASLPSASAVTGAIYRVTDAGNNLFISDGTIWKPTTGIAVLGKSSVGVSHTGDTAEFVAATITLPASLIGANGCVRAHTAYTMPSSVNSKSVRVRLGGIGGTSFLSIAATLVTAQELEGIICNRNAENSQYSNGFSNRGTDQLLTANSYNTGAVNTANSQDLVITIQNANAGETTTLESYTVELLK